MMTPPSWGGTSSLDTFMGHIQKLGRIIDEAHAPKNRCGNCCFFERLPNHEYFGRCGYGWLGRLRRKFGPTKDDLRSCRRWAPDMSRL